MVAVSLRTPSRELVTRGRRRSQRRKRVASTSSDGTSPPPPHPPRRRPVRTVAGAARKNPRHQPSNLQQRPSVFQRAFHQRPQLRPRRQPPERPTPPPGRTRSYYISIRISTISTRVATGAAAAAAVVLVVQVSEGPSARRISSKRPVRLPPSWRNSSPAGSNRGRGDGWMGRRIAHYPWHVILSAGQGPLHLHLLHHLRFPRWLEALS